jgi:hypothetical protein
MATQKKSASRSSSKSVSLPQVDSNSSVSVRKIENGFIISESGTTGKGRNQTWYNKDRYSPTNPLKMEVATKMNFSKKK